MKILKNNLWRYHLARLSVVEDCCRTLFIPKNISYESSKYFQLNKNRFLEWKTSGKVLSVSVCFSVKVLSIFIPRSHIALKLPCTLYEDDKAEFKQEEYCMVIQMVLRTFRPSCWCMSVASSLWTRALIHHSRMGFDDQVFFQRWLWYFLLITHCTHMLCD